MKYPTRLSTLARDDGARCRVGSRPTRSLATIFGWSWRRRARRPTITRRAPAASARTPRHTPARRSSRASSSSIARARSAAAERRLFPWRPVARSRGETRVSASRRLRDGVPGEPPVVVDDQRGGRRVGERGRGRGGARARARRPRRQEPRRTRLPPGPIQDPLPHRHRLAETAQTVARVPLHRPPPQILRLPAIVRRHQSETRRERLRVHRELRRRGVRRPVLRPLPQTESVGGGTPC